MDDVVIIGAGPAGLTAGMYCRLRRLSVLVLDAGRAGGQLRSVYAAKMVHDWPGRPAVVAADLADDLATHAEELGVPVVEGEKVVEVRRVGEGFEVVGRDVAVKVLPRRFASDTSFSNVSFFFSAIDDIDKRLYLQYYKPIL